MLNKNDPLIGAVQEVMKKNQAEREAAKIVNEAFGVEDRKALPHELQSEWDAAYKSVLTEGAESLDEEIKNKLTSDHKTAITELLRKKWKEPKARVKFSKDSLGGHHATITSERQGMDLTHSIKVKNGKVSVSGSPHTESQLEEETLDEKVKMTKKEFANLDGDPKFTANDLAHVRAGTHKKKAASGELEENNLDEAGMMPTGIKRVLARLKAGWLANKHNNRALGNDPYQRTPPENYKKDIEQAIKYKKIEKRLRKEDVTSPSSMGISKPDYAPAGTKPDYAVRKTVGPKSDLIKKPTMSSGNSTVTQTGKTSSSATKSTMKESNLQEEPVSKAQRRFFGLVRGIQKGEAHGSAKAEKAAETMSAKSVRDYAKTSEKGLPEKVSEALTGNQIKGQTTYGTGSNPTQRPYDVNNPNDAKGSYAAMQGAADRSKMDKTSRTSSLSKSTSTPGYAAPAPKLSASTLSGPQAAAKARQAGVQRLAQAAKSTSTPGYALPASPAAKTGPSFERTGRGGSPSMAPKPADRPNDLGKAGVPGTGGKLAPAAAPKPTAKPVQAVKKPAAAAPVKNASTRGGTMSQSDANVLAKVKAGGGQKLSKILPSGRERLKFFAARNAERRGP